MTEQELLIEAFKHPEKDTQVDIINLLLDLIPEQTIEDLNKKITKTETSGIIDVPWNIQKFLENQCKYSVHEDTDFRVDQLGRLDDLFVRLFERGYVPSQSTSTPLFKCFGTYGLIKSFEKAITIDNIQNDNLFTQNINGALDHAIKHRQLEFVKAFVKLFPKNDLVSYEYMLGVAVKGESLEIVKTLLSTLQKNVVVNTTKLLKSATSSSSKCDPYIIEYIYENYLYDIIPFNSSVLEWAMKIKKYDVVHFTLKNDFDPNKIIKYAFQNKLFDLIDIMLKEKMIKELSTLLLKKDEILSKETIEILEKYNEELFDDPKIVEKILHSSVIVGDIDVFNKMIKRKSVNIAKELAQKEDTLDAFVIEYIKKTGCFPDNLKLQRC